MYIKPIKGNKYVHRMTAKPNPNHIHDMSIKKTASEELLYGLLYKFNI